MRRVLLMCQRCDQVCGCTEPGTQTCGDCGSHDCPVLPAPVKHRGYCAACKSRFRALLFRGPWVGLVGPSPCGG